MGSPANQMGKANSRMGKEEPRWIIIGQSWPGRMWGFDLG